jgi:hypothetical protein
VAIAPANRSIRSSPICGLSRLNLKLSFANYRGVKGCYLSLEKQYRAIAEEYHKVLLRMLVGGCQIGDIEFLNDTLPPGDEARASFDELTLLPTNAGVDAANERIMRTLFPWAPEEVFVAQNRPYRPAKT